MKLPYEVATELIHCGDTSCATKDVSPFGDAVPVSENCESMSL